MSTRIATLPWGYLESYDDNEIAIVSTIPDPPKVRLAVQAERVESNLGAVSFNLRRPDGRHEEYGLVMGRLTPDRQEGAVYVALRPRGQQECREVLYLDPGAAIFRVPVSAPNVGMPAPGLPRRIALRAVANGRLVCAEDAGRQSLIANRDLVGPWETFEVIALE